MIVTPALREVHARVATVADEPVHISGSGSTLFVPCPDSLHAGTLAGAIRTQLGLPAVPVSSCTVEAGLLEER